MKRPTAAVLTVLSLCACSTAEGDRPTQALPPENLLAGAAALAGQPMETVVEGRWSVRRTTGSGSSPGSSATGAAMEYTRDHDAEAGDERMAAAAPAGTVPTDPAPEPDGEARPDMRFGVVGDAGVVGDTASDRGGAVPPAEVAVLDDLEHDTTDLLTVAKASSASATPNTAMPLRAGKTDDNVEFVAFTDWLAGATAEGRLGDRYQPLDVFDRRAIRVIDVAGDVVPGARVQVVDEGADRVAWRGTTLGDGRIPFYPGVAAGTGDRPATWLIEAQVGDAVTRSHWNLDGTECTVRMPGAIETPDEVVLDVVFLIDTTGSMGDEIDRIKATLQGVTAKLDSLEREFSLRYGAVLYRDVGDAYVTMAHPFTADLDAFEQALQAIGADGGGDTPESLNQGLAVAVDGMEWREQGAKLVFLIADASPHMDYQDDIPYGDSLTAAVARGIRIHAVAASGLDEAGTVVFRQIAQFTRGKFIFVEYGSDVVASGAAHGVAGKVESNNLDDILFEQIRDEIARWGRAE